MERPEAIAPPIRQTVDWLLDREEFGLAKGIARAVEARGSDRSPELFDFLAYVFHRAKEHREAAAYSLRTLELLPHSIEARFNASKCLRMAGQPDAAERLITSVLEARPDWVDPWLDLAACVGTQGRQDEATQLLMKVIGSVPPGEPNHEIAQFNLGWQLIRQGRLKAGLAQLARGRRLGVWGDKRLVPDSKSLTPGQSLRGKRVLVLGEGGAGDEMINLRFAEMIHQAGGQVSWLSRHGLASLFRRAPGVDEAFDRGEAAPAEFDLWVPCMDLPHVLGVDWEQLPSAPYLRPDSAYSSKWEKLIPASTHLKVGIRWQGNALYDQDLMRSVSFSRLKSWFGVPRVTFYSLQRDSGVEQLSADSGVVDLSSQLGCWEDTAAAIQRLDLVISTCTSVPHLAAAMGKPTWLLTPLDCYYLWASPGERSPWYSSVRLYRQSRFDSWSEPIEAVRTALNALTARN